MRTRERLHLVGRVTFWLVEGDLDDAGVRDVLTGRRPALRVARANLVTNVGRQQIAKRITDQAGVTSPTHIALGTTVFTPAVGDTMPTGEFFRKVCSTVAPHQSYFARYVMSALTTEANGTIKGAFLLTAAAGGDLWAEVSADIVKTSGQSLLSEWTIEVKS